MEKHGITSHLESGNGKPKGACITYVAELDADVDDVIAAEYLYQKGVLKQVVCDPAPRTANGRERRQMLESLGIRVSGTFPPDARYVFVGGALSALAGYLVFHKIECLVMNGGFIGSNICKHPLPKFRKKETVRTFNFNCDAAATDRVLKSPNIKSILLIGKNVCHDPRNTQQGIWAEERNLLEKYQARPDKLQHDMLACREGLVYLGLLEEPSYLEYLNVYPYHTGLRGNQTCWGSSFQNLCKGYRKVTAAVTWKTNE